MDAQPAASAPPAALPAVPRVAAVRRAGTLLATAALLGGCASAPPVPNLAPATAPSGATAKLLLRAAVPANDVFAVVQLTDAEQCKGPKLLIAGTPQKTPTPALLAAGSLATLDFVILRGGKPSCGVRWSFTPAAGKTYLMQGLVLGAGCTARLLDASAPDRPLQPPDAVLRSGPGQACLPLAQARAAGTGAMLQGGQQDGEAVLNPNASAADLRWLVQP